jgi:hypothetical protein
MLKYHIQTVELASAQKVIQFNSIPQDYSDLYVVISGRSDRTSDARDELFIQFNGDTSNYSSRSLRGSGSAADTVTSTAAGITRINLPSATTTSNTFGNGSMYILNYNSNIAKSISVDSVMENNATFSFQDIVAGLWNNTSPITRLSVFPEVGNFTAGSTISLYGVRRGSDGKTEAASGGVITTSGGYTIHTFNTSGTFVANRDLDVEYLVIAGGGGGGDRLGGGGGAGGYRSSVSGEISGGGSSTESKIRVSSGQSALVTVGAGGAGGTGENRGSQGANSSFASIVSIGGGGGGGINQRTGGNGGSGGGNCGEDSVSPSGSGISDQGYSGSLNSPQSTAGGGGGAGSTGATIPDVSNQGKDGGDGIASSINGTLTYRAGGGGGSQDTFNSSNQGDGGLGGGGNGSTGASNGSAGTSNTGGGGGGAGNNGQTGITGGAGGSGAVIIRYLTP